MADSPCIKVCQLHTVDGLAYCAGCYRTPEEIQYWAEFEEHIQDYILEQCYNRRHDIHESMGFQKKSKE